MGHRHIKKCIILNTKDLNDEIMEGRIFENIDEDLLSTFGVWDVKDDGTIVCNGENDILH